MTRHYNGGGDAPLAVHLAAASPAQHQPSCERACVEIMPAFPVSAGSCTTGSADACVRTVIPQRGASAPALPPASSAPASVALQCVSLDTGDTSGVLTHYLTPPCQARIGIPARTDRPPSLASRWGRPCAAEVVGVKAPRNVVGLPVRRSPQALLATAGEVSSAGGLGASRRASTTLAHGSPHDRWTASSQLRCVDVQ
jgi:hypothetical protein